MRNNTVLLYRLLFSMPVSCGYIWDWHLQICKISFHLASLLCSSITLYFILTMETAYVQFQDKYQTWIQLSNIVLIHITSLVKTNLSVPGGLYLFHVDSCTCCVLVCLESRFGCPQWQRSGQRTWERRTWTRPQRSSTSWWPHPATDTWPWRAPPWRWCLTSPRPT